MPISSTFTRGTAGVAVGEGLGSSDPSGEADGSTAKSGSLGSTGGAVSVGTHAPPSATGANTSVAASRASTVRPAMTSWGPRTMSTEIASAAMVVARAVIGVMTRVAPTANSRQPTTSASTTRIVVSTCGSNSRAASAVRSLVAARRTRASSRISSGPPSSSAHFQRPAARWPRPGKMALSSRKRGACEGGSPTGDDGGSPAWTGSSDIAGKDAVDRRLPQPTMRRACYFIAPKYSSTAGHIASPASSFACGSPPPSEISVDRST